MQASGCSEYFAIVSTGVSKFKSVKEEALFNEEVDVKVYNKLIAQINKNLNVLHNITTKKSHM